jgi:hypothetical protein
MISGALAAPAAANVLARRMTSENAVRSLAEKTVLNPAAAPAGLTALAREDRER